MFNEAARVGPHSRAFYDEAAGENLVSSEAEIGWCVEGIPLTVAHRGFVPAHMDESENPRGIRKLEPEGL